MLGVNIMDPLVIDPESFLIFIDETGHERMVDQKYPIFGMGGCAAMGHSDERLLKEPWRQLKAQCFGGPDIPIHAADLYGIRRDQGAAAMQRILQNQPLLRFYDNDADNHHMPDELVPYHATSGSIVRRIEAIARPYLLNSLTIIFESSERLDTLTARYFVAILFRDSAGAEIPVECFRMKIV